MEILNGKGVYEDNGIAIGRILVCKKGEQTVKRECIADIQAEITRFEEAKETAKKQLSKLYEKALKEVGKVSALIFEMHQMMLDDLEYTEAVLHKIEDEAVNAEYAVAVTRDYFSEKFASMEDDYLKERATDVKDISNRVLSILQGNETKSINSGETVIMAAEDLTPSEILQLDRSKVLAVAIKYGSIHSHTAVLAKIMNIPLLIGVDYPLSCHRKMAVLNAYEGRFYIEPTKEIIEQAKELKKEEEDRNGLFLELKGQESVTSDGKKIKLFSNIGSISDMDAVLQNDAEGVGLFRSEFLCFESERFPTEEEQFQAYKTVAMAMEGKKVIIRTFDIGADKQMDYFQMEKEANPAMGYRGIRVCLDQKDMFQTQLRAIYRASHYGNISIMYPMIISVKEVKEIKKIVEGVKAELEEQGIPFGEVEQGVMIETPAAVIISDLLAKEVDFFSIGTNDLTQYTLAVDRQNAKLAPFYDSHHEAVLRMIKMAVDNGHKEGCYVGICGELAADTSLIETFLEMGVDELSVSPSAILKLREKIRGISFS